jgi:hypothetical protein
MFHVTGSWNLTWSRLHVTNEYEMWTYIRPLKRGSIHIKFSMTGQEKCDLLIQVTA